MNKIQLLTSCEKSGLSDCPASLNNPATLGNTFCWSLTLYSVVLMSFHVHFAQRHLTFLTPSPVWWVTWCHRFILRSVLKSLSFPVSADHVKGWMQLFVTSPTCSLEPTSRGAAARAGHSKNWDKFGRSGTAFHSPRAHLGPPKLHWLHIHGKRTSSHISSALLSQWLRDSSRGAAHGGKQGD